MPNKGKKDHHRIYLKISPEVFREEFLKAASEIMDERGESDVQFRIDDSNRELINQLYFYLVGSENYEKDLKKGLYLYGSHGFGKTVILLSLISVIEKFSPRRFIRMTAREFCSVTKGMDVYQFKKKSMFLDDIFKEVLEAQWNKEAFVKLVEAQYNYGAWVFWASNYRFETLINGKGNIPGYGKITTDRMKSMVNFHLVEGKSKRR